MLMILADVTQFNPDEQVVATTLLWFWPKFTEIRQQSTAGRVYVLVVQSLLQSGCLGFAQIRHNRKTTISKEAIKDSSIKLSFSSEKTGHSLKKGVESPHPAINNSKKSMVIISNEWFKYLK
ncbi:hypothetical protein WA026_006222 [Henosepilachna vigintioctopunctata]|uniref:Uncharacterized protein n=1 Tax=Henosepilachna vigintioctopunctata TaxID=420089 RepID=A0AAW1TJR9_9CUCU